MDTSLRKKTNILDLALCMVVVLACMVPRYIATFKIKVGINISYYDIALLLLWVIVANKRYVKKQFEVLFFFFWLCIAFMSVWRSEAINLWAYYILYLSITILAIQFFNTISSERVFDLAARAFSFALLIHVLIGLYEVTHHRYLFEVGSFSKRYYGKTAVSIFHNPNDYSTFLIVLLPFSIYCMTHARRFGEKIINAGIIIASVVLLILGESRLAIIALFLMGGMIYIALVRKSRYRFLCDAFLIFMAAVIILTPSVRSWIGRVLRNNTLNLNSNSDIIRVNLIKNGLAFLKQTYGFGVGAGNLYDWFKFRSVYNIGNILYMHNWYIEILATFGILLFVLYMIFHIRILIDLFRQAAKEKNILGIHVAYLSSFLCFSIMSISSSTNVYSEWVWMYLALLCSYCVFYRKRGELTEVTSS